MLWRGDLSYQQVRDLGRGCIALLTWLDLEHLASSLTVDGCNVKMNPTAVACWAAVSLAY